MPEDHSCRVRLHAAAGRRDEALAEFERAVDLGFRGTVIDWVFVSIEYDPTLDGLRDDPRFKTQMKRIKDDLARQRVAAEAWRKGRRRAERSPSTRSGPEPDHRGDGRGLAPEVDCAPSWGRTPPTAPASRGQ